MAVLPVSGYRVSNYRNTTSFTGRNRRDESSMQKNNQSNGINPKLASVPVVVMLAMTPSMLNSKDSVAAIPITEGNMTEILTKIPTTKVDESTLDFSELQSPQQQSRRSSYVRPEITQYEKKFTMDGKQYTMYYVSLAKEDHKNTTNVDNVYFVPADFVPIRGTDDDLNEPPNLINLIYHDIGENEFVGAYVRYKTIDSDYEGIIHKKEIRLPDEIANELIDLVVGDTKFEASPFISKIKTTHSAKLIPDKEL